MPGGRGGRRSGKVGKPYPNRSDLSGGPQPISAAPGQTYGAAGAQLDAQRAVPMGSPDVAGAPAGPPGPLPSHIPLPGQLGDIFGDSQDPSEHVMSGARLGPGPGPGAFGLGDAGAGADYAKMAPWIPALERIANSDSSSAATKQLVRLIKANISMTPGQVNR